MQTLQNTEVAINTMDNQEKLETYVTQDDDKQNKKHNTIMYWTPLYVNKLK